MQAPLFSYILEHLPLMKQLYTEFRSQAQRFTGYNCSLGEEGFFTWCLVQNRYHWFHRGIFPLQEGFTKPRPAAFSGESCMISSNHPMLGLKHVMSNRNWLLPGVAHKFFIIFKKSSMLVADLAFCLKIRNHVLNLYSIHQASLIITIRRKKKKTGTRVVIGCTEYDHSLTNYKQLYSYCF